MTVTLLSVLLLFAAVDISAQGDTPADANDPSRSMRRKVTCPDDSTSFRPIQCWPGSRFIFLSASSDKHPFYGFKGGKGKFDAPDYHEAVGRTGVITDVHYEEPYWHFTLKMEDNGQIYTSERIDIDSNGSGDNVDLDGVALASDIDYIRNRYKGDTMWLRKPVVISYDYVKREFTTREYRDSVRIVITDVVPAWYAWTPVRVIFKTGDGREWFQDIAVSRTNTGPTLRDKGYSFDQVFSAVPVEVERGMVVKKKEKKKRKKRR